MKTLIRQILGCLVYLSNHLIFILIRDEPLSFEMKVVNAIMATVIILICLYDYQFNYKKTGKFKVPVELLMLFNVMMWITAGSYLFVAINLILLVTFIFWKKRIADSEDLAADLK